MNWTQRSREFAAPFAAQRPIDVTAFLGAWPFRRAARADMAGMADEFELDRVCLSHLDSVFGFDTRSGNEELFRATENDERMLRFPILNPAEPGWRHEWAWAIGEGMHGVRIVPGYHGYRLTDPFVAELVAAAGEQWLPLHVCARLEDDRVRHPRYQVSPPDRHEVAELLRVVPVNRAVFLSGLNLADWREIREHLGADMPRRVGVDLWFVNAPLAAVETLCGDGLADVFCYGSAAPVQTAHATAIQLGTANITEEQRAALCRDNALGLLNIDV